MSTAAKDDGMERVVAAFSALRDAIAEIPDSQDRKIARDAIRDALDRDAAQGEAEEIVAGSYTRIGRLHRGSFYEVLSVRQRDTGSFHALKAPLPERGSDPLLRRLLLAEATNQGRVLHAACLPMRALLRLPDGRPALLTDLIEAPTLAEVLAQRAPTEADALSLALRLLDALEAVHGAGLTHGDLKPSNVFVPRGDFGAAILFDFGLSHRIGEPLAAVDLIRACSPGYAAPETADPAARAAPGLDLFALGRVLSRCLGDGPEGSIASLVSALVNEDPAARPVSARDARSRAQAAAHKPQANAKAASLHSEESFGS